MAPKKVAATESTTPLIKPTFIFYYVPSDFGIAPADTLEFEKIIASLSDENRKNLHLVIHTLGGDPYTASKIVHLIQHSFESVSAIIPYWAMSAGTLLSLGANEIVMSDIAQLGPLDMQVEHPGTEKTISALDYTGAVSYAVGQAKTVGEVFFNKIDRDSQHRIKCKDSMGIAYRNAVKLFEPLMSQLDPVQLSNCARILEVAELYGKDFLKKYSLKREFQDDSIADLLIRYLIYRFPSHGYGIYYDVASELPLNVVSQKDYPYWSRVWEQVKVYVESDLRRDSKFVKTIKLLDIK